MATVGSTCLQQDTINLSDRNHIIFAHKVYPVMANGESDFKADELDSIINVIGLRPNDPLDGFGEMWYQVFLWALFSSMFVHIIATLIALVQLRKHKIGRWIPLGIFAMGVVSPITLGSVSSAAIAGFYRASDVEMMPFYALLWGLGQTIIGIVFSFTRILATL